METRQQPDEADLLRRIAARDPEALGLLYDRYARVVHGLCLKTLGSPEDAEETTLDVFTQIWRTGGTYDPGRARVEVWIFQLARSRAIDKLRRREREGRAAVASEAAAQAMPQVEIHGPESDVLLTERRREVRQALSQLPEAQRLALELAYYKGLSHTEIARETGESLGTTKTRIRLGLAKLREALASWWNE